MYMYITKLINDQLTANAISIHEEVSLYGIYFSWIV